MITLINRNGFYIRATENVPTNGSEILEYVSNKICQVSGIPLPKLKGRDRYREITVWRQIGMNICYRKAVISYREIGLYYGGRDHSSVLHSVNVIDDLIDAKDAQVNKCLQVLLPALNFNKITLRNEA